MTLVRKAAADVLATGTYSSFIDGAITGAEMSAGYNRSIATRGRRGVKIDASVESVLIYRPFKSPPLSSSSAPS
jgi:hypothetical protein